MTTAINESVVRDVVQEVLTQLKGGAPVATRDPAGRDAPALHIGASSPITAKPAKPAAPSTGASAGKWGVFGCVDEAVAAAKASQAWLQEQSIATRAEIVQIIRDVVRTRVEELGRMELDETKIGRLDHKFDKLHLIINHVSGTEFLQSEAYSGDMGLTVVEHAPYGVLGVITPVTHSIPTMTANAINMIAAGNAMVINAHPSGHRSAALAADAYNRMIRDDFGIDPLLCIIDPPTIESANAIFAHPDVPLLVVTGGPAVARAAMKQAKRAIVAGPGNPPVVVDESADLDRAARSIIAGAAFDNNLLCIGEKEVFVVESVFDPMMAAMRRAGAAELDAGQIERLTAAAFERHKSHYAVSKDLIGRDVPVLAEAAGARVPEGTDLLFGRTSEDNPFVPEEQMMPFVPFVPVRDFDEGLRLAVKHEHGFGHTAIIHSNNLEHITRMGRVMNTTIFVANGPCTAGLGVGGEGYPSYSIATPTGEGITNPLTFTRFRRASVSGSLRTV